MFKPAKIAFRDGYVNNQGESPLYLVVHVAAKKLRFSTGISIRPELWDPKNQIIIGKTKLIRDQNLILGSCLARISDIAVKYRLQHQEITPEQLKHEYSNYSARIDFLEFMENEIKGRTGELEASTLRHHSSVLKKLQEWRPKIIFSELSETLWHEYKSHLKLVKKNDQATISSNLKAIKTYINRAVRQKIISENPFRYISRGQSKNDRTFLEEPEIKKLIEIYDHGDLFPFYQKALRRFLFSIATGCRISDVKSLSNENLFKGTLIFTPRKTRNSKAAVIRIPITALAMRMIQDEAGPSGGPLFPGMPDQKVNQALKKIATQAGIERSVSFHAGRHTFATYFYRKTRNLVALQKLLGHSNVRETMVYTHVLTDDLEKEMQCFDGFCEQPKNSKTQIEQKEQFA